MRGPPIWDLGVTHLEHVFSPPGLPLPYKGAEDIGTTSILIRGGPGSGKTTLALALAHAIAKAGDGLVLYLTTEFSPVEVTFKATLLGLPEASVEHWPGSGEVAVGEVLVEHLAAVQRDDAPRSSTELRRQSVDAVWSLLHPAASDAVGPARPVRAIVIDALTLLDPSAPEAELRAELVAFVQALEGEGRSVILVEELATGAAAWSAFVVDVVFDLSMAPHQASGELRRKLTLSKCRYALSIPGPHDYGLDDGRPATWPNLFRVVSGRDHGLRGVEFPKTLIAVEPAGHWQPLAGQLVFIPQGSEWPFLEIIDKVPGIRPAEVSVTSEIRFTLGKWHQRSREYSAEPDGAQFIGWWFQRDITRDVNALFVWGIENVVVRDGEIATVHVLEALKTLGYLVCVIGIEQSMEYIKSNCDFVWRKPSRDPGARNVVGASSPIQVWGSRPLHMSAEKTSSLLLNDIPRRSFALHLFGVRARLHKDLWEQYYCGQDWHAAGNNLHIHGGKQNAVIIDRLLWIAMHADVSGNDAAVNMLRAHIGKEEELWIADPLLRSLARMGNLDEIERIASDVCSRLGQPDSMRERMVIEALLAAPKQAGALALARASSLIARADLADHDRQDLLFNIAAVASAGCFDESALRAFEQRHPELGEARKMPKG